MITGLLQKLRTKLAIDRRRYLNRSSLSPLHKLKPEEVPPTEVPNHQISHRNTTNSSWLRILLTSVGVTILVLGFRSLKWLQPWELSAYDQMLRLRPPEALDPRILIVTISEEDLQRENLPMSADTIHQMLAKLQSYHPRVIGLNIYLPHKHLAVGEVRDNIIGVCKLSSIGDPEVASPSISMDNVGFNNLVADDDGIIRRSLLFARAKKDKQCATSYSFAALLAINYLKKQGIQQPSLDKKDFYLGKTFFRTLRKDSGSYEQISANGRQILLNYHDPNHLAKQITLSQLLSDRLNPSLIKDKLVIIGTTSSRVQPSLYTPYSASPTQPAVMPTVFIQTQTVSQILSTVLDGRPLIWYWSDGVEAVWVWVWSLAGGVLAWRLRHPLYLGLTGAASIAGLVGVCFVLFIQAGWVPVVPSMLTFILSLFSIMAYTTYRTQQYTKLITLQVEKQLEAIAQLNILLKEDTETQRSRNAENSANFSPSSPSPLLSQRYKLTKVLAQGGFGCTYLAEDTQRPGNPICVVKQLMPARRDPRFLQVARRLFDAEANILEALGTHEQIPELLAFFEENNQFYLVQEYIQGQLLSDELAPGGKQNESFVKDMLLGILEVLAFVHEHRVIHRDIKPSNIIRRALDNRLVLIDFGAVKQMQPLNTEQTELATVAIGTRGYSPPEQFVGHPRLSSDIYAVGMIGIQAVTGIPPQELQQHADTGTVLWRELAQISPELAVILDKMVCYHFSDRYQSAAAALQDLKQI